MSTIGTSHIPPTTDKHDGATTSTGTHSGMSPELERTLGLLSSHRSVLGYMLLSREPVSVIRTSGVIFDGEQGRKYVGVVKKIVDCVKEGLDEVNGGDPDADDIKFMRIRTRRHEIMISPDDRYLLAVLHDPGSNT